MIRLRHRAEVVLRTPAHKRDGVHYDARDVVVCRCGGEMNVDSTSRTGWACWDSDGYYGTAESPFGYGNAAPVRVVPIAEAMTHAG